LCEVLCDADHVDVVVTAFSGVRGVMRIVVDALTTPDILDIEGRPSLSGLYLVKVLFSTGSMKGTK